MIDFLKYKFADLEKVFIQSKKDVHSKKQEINDIVKQMSKAKKD